MKNALATAALLCLAALPAHPELPPAATLGKQRAAATPMEWETREAGHPILGNIRFAFIKNSVETPVGKDKVYSRAYFSCQRSTKKFAIELTNATAPDDPKGLKANADPRLYCNRPIQPWDEKLVQEEILTHWDMNEIGDALAQGLRPFPLRECVWIHVVQELALPAGWAQKSAKVEFDILPYNKELDSIFASCGEQSAYAPAKPAAPVAVAKAASPPIVAAKAPPPPKPAPAPAPPANLAWEMARVPASGKTNVRAAPNIQSAIVIQLDPGAVVLVQKTGNEWWRAKSTTGSGFQGYIRQDRLVFK